MPIRSSDLFAAPDEALGQIRVLDLPRAALDRIGATLPTAAGLHVALVGFGRPGLQTASAMLAAGASVTWLVPSFAGPPAIGDSDGDLGIAGRSWVAAPGSGPAFMVAEGRRALAATDVIFIGAPTPHDHPATQLAPLGRACAMVVDAAVPGQTIIVTASCYVGCTRDLLVTPLEERGLVVGRDVHVELSPQWCGLEDAPDPAAVTRIVGEATREGTRTAPTILRPIAHVRPARSLEAMELGILGAPPDRMLALAAKRAIDLTVAALGLLLLSPVLALVALAILLDDGPPVLFTQVRAGQGGRVFGFRKFRTMVDGAERRLPEVLKLNQIHGPAFQIEHDPRQTRLGAFLRRSSLDELPQLWNVLVGEMSLVGPRPAPMCEVGAYEAWHRRRLSVKPGITGFAQIRARRYREFDEKACLDLEYIDRWSVWLDLSILIRTVPTVLRLTGR